MRTAATRPVHHAAPRAAQKKSPQSGFTLVEFAIVMIMSGLLMAVAVQLYAVELKRQRHDDTRTNLRTMQDILSHVKGISGRYPCPADPTLAIDDPNYGVENCAVSVAVGSCTGGTTGVCKSAGSLTIDTDNDGVPDQAVDIDGDGNPDNVLTGAYPYKTVIDAYTTLLGTTATMDSAERRKQIKFGDQRTGIDGWGRQITYVVTETMTVWSSFENRGGAIRVEDENGQVLTKNGAHYAVITHGANGYGAYTNNGKAFTACNDPLASASEQENCNNDGTIVKPNVRSYSNTGNQNDDMALYAITIDSSLWEEVPGCTDLAGANVNCIRNKNPGMVGVSTAGASVTERFEVVDDGSGDDAIRTQRSMSDEVCDLSNLNCFTPRLFGGSADTALNTCDQTGLPSNQINAVVKVANGRVECRVVTLNTTGARHGQRCPTGQYVVGFNSSGDVVCELITAP